MSITDHPGFLAAIAESTMTARQATEFVSAVEGLEGSIADCARLSKDDCRVPSSLLRDRETYPTVSGRSSLDQLASEFLRMPLLPCESSASIPIHEMTAGEIIALGSTGVQSTPTPETEGMAR